MLSAIAAPFVAQTLDAVHFPLKYLWIFPPIKVAAAIGLFSVYRLPALARLTTALLTVDFARPSAFVSGPRPWPQRPGATTFMAVFAAMTARGLSVIPGSFTADAPPRCPLRPSKAT